MSRRKKPDPIVLQYTRECEFGTMSVEEGVVYWQPKGSQERVVLSAGREGWSEFSNAYLLTGGLSMTDVSVAEDRLGEQE
jgi:hypothetical protein